MRMRKKKHCGERMERCAPVWIKEPEGYRGAWSMVFGNSNPIHGEIGCGKGRFLLQTALEHPDINYVALERIEDVLVMAMEKAMEAGVTNLRFVNGKAEDLEGMFAAGELERIYLNFSDPWKKNKQAKRRLTHPDFLTRYRHVLAPSGAIFFKTDNQKLFEFSLNSFSDCGFHLRQITFDLHHSGMTDNVMTEYEQRFFEQGLPIYRVEALC